MILLTGGAGYIASHTGVALAQAGIPYVVLDNFCNSQPGVLSRMGVLGGASPVFVQGDVRDAATLDALFARYPIEGVIHFAGLKAVGESVAEPSLYYDNNVSGTVTLIRAMERAGVKQMVFSSSATVYGDPESLPLTETSRLGPINPYGQSKLMVEHILRDVATAHPDWRVACLRYFNPVGAHPSGLMGEDPRGVPGNLMPFIGQVAVGRRPQLSIFGNDYPTVDGTGVRDYIHVMDLADGHLAALRYLQGDRQDSNYLVANLGTGQGISVLQMVQAFEQYSGQRVPYVIAPRRPGDSASCYADPSVAHQLLGWKAVRGLKEMCQDTWNWQHRNPNGYADPAH
ncbi:UDP-glucose 4-epimerase GalE [Curvibacter sp. HBC28]|uniref:UDP-glucose 4-epimerase n=1 Tax=Curvibacter microcysteis TaxID=3026419 RepID=A0ABT5MDE7_9BURK|nr:UDP-glucose 4-epimerase GalE [Curvibacter sp. HBC28]MDD0814599.1 UDP-glucose 4-epimerase GalE [Curvibacter sp. HBC28]